MAVHLTQSTRLRRAAILAMAIAAGVVAFMYASGDDEPDNLRPGAERSRDARVLGVVVTQDTLPTAAPASPATFGESGDPDGASTTTARPSPGTTATTRPGATLVPPTVIENTTSTTRPTTPSTIDLSTTTTDGTETTTTTALPQE